MPRERQRATFGRKERIKKESDFDRLFRTGKRVTREQYSLIVSRNEGGRARLAVSVKKKIGNAAVRNYEKRLCREFFRRENDRIQKGRDYMIIVRGRSRNFRDSYHRLTELFRQFFEVHKGV